MSGEPREDLRRLDALVGTWDSTAVHPSLPDVEVPGVTTFEWLEGGHFLIGRSTNDHARFPDAIQIFGAGGDAITVHYYDSRGYTREYSTRIEDGVWRSELQRAQDWHQRFEGRFEDDGSTIAGLWLMSYDHGATWEPDLQITYRRRS